MKKKNYKNMIKLVKKSATSKRLHAPAPMVFIFEI